MPESKMPLQDIKTPPTYVPHQSAPEGDRAGVLKVLSGAMMGLLAVALLGYGVFYFSSVRATQILIAMLLYGVLIATSFLSYREADGGNARKAILWLVAGMMVSPWIGCLIADWRELSGVAYLLELLLLLWLWTPGTWGWWIGGPVLYTLYLAGVFYLVPLTPYAIAVHSWLDIVNGVVVGGIIFTVAIIAFYRLYKQWSYRLSIVSQFRLAFIIVIVMVAVAVGGGGGWLSYRNSLYQAERQLQIIADYRANEIQAWAEDLRLNLKVEAERPASLDTIRTLVSAASITEARTHAHDELLTHFRSVITSRGVFENIIFINAEGIVLVSTGTIEEGKNYSAVKYFQEGKKDFYIHPFYYAPGSGQMVLTLARPVKDNGGDLLGVLVAQVNLGRLQTLLSRGITLGDTDEVYLLAPSHMMLTHSRFKSQRVYVFSEGAQAAIEGHQNGVGQYEDYRGHIVVGVYRWLDDLQVALLAEQDRSEILRPSRNMLVLSALIMLVATILGGVAASVMARNLGEPLRDLAEVATSIAGGNWERVVEVQRRDEIGVLAQAFNKMTAELRAMVSSLEQRVAERTRVLEHRSQQLLAAAQVSRRAVLIRDKEQLLDIVVHQISERFGFYHAGVFLIDDQGRYAVLQAASSEGGQRMLARGHKLRLGAGIVGYVAETGKPRIALDVGEDAHFFNNPDLPHTRSEMGLPLQGHDRLLGVLDVQSTEPGAFTEADVTVLQTMADQVAMAIENTQLLAEAEARLQEVRRLLQSQSREDWIKILRERSNIGYLYDGIAVRPYDEAALALAASELPIEVRDQIIGKVHLKLPEGAVLGEDEWELVQGILAQAGEALESARQFQAMQASLAEADILYRGGRAMASVSSGQEALQVFVDYLVQPGIDRCVFLIVDPETVEDEVPIANIKAAWERGNPHPEVLGNKWPLTPSSLFWWLFFEARSDVIVLDDIATSPVLDESTRRILLSGGLKSAVIVPLLVSDRLLGWFMAESLNAPYQFSEREVRLYRSLADQAAMALRRFQLLQEANERADREQLAVELTSRIREPFELERILEIAAQELAKALSLEEVVIQLAEEDER